MPLHYQLKNGDFVEILTSKQGRGPSRDWLSLAKSSRARNKIRQWFSRETREDTEQKGREALEQALKRRTCRTRSSRGSAVLAQVIRDTGFKKAEDFYLALGSGKLPAGRDRQQGHPAAEDRAGRRGGAGRHEGAEGARAVGGADMGVVVEGVERRARPAREVLHAGAGRRDRRLHLARQGDHDPPRRLPEREGAEAQPGAVHAGRVGRAARRRASASRSRSTRGTARACSRTSRARSPSTARTSSATAASSRISSRRTGTRPRSATSSRCARCSLRCAISTPCSTRTASRRPNWVPRSRDLGAENGSTSIAPRSRDSSPDQARYLNRGIGEHPHDLTYKER